MARHQPCARVRRPPLRPTVAIPTWNPTVTTLLFFAAIYGGSAVAFGLLLLCDWRSHRRDRRAEAALVAELFDELDRFLDDHP